MKIPEFLKQSIIDNKTSLGNHPALPPEDDDLFLMSIIKSIYESVMKHIDTDDRKEINNRLNKLLTECKQEEEKSKEALEMLSSQVLTQIFSIPDDTIEIEGNLVNECDMSKYRIVPDSTPDFEFKDIKEMNDIGDIIYQRRMINSLIAGISNIYANTYDLYIQEIWKINPKLVNLYDEINKYNLALLYNQPDNIKNIEKSNTGCVDVNIIGNDKKIHIKAEGIIFPILLEYLIKGVLEIASIKGLNLEQDRIEYILGKTDYRLAEYWDLRLGIPLWQKIIETAEKTNFNINDFEPNFIIMELSKLEPKVFNNLLQNVYKKTTQGTVMLYGFLNIIDYNKNKDDFDNFIHSQNEKYPINDSEEYTSEELLEEINNEYNNI